jgi:FtsH ternary system domain X1
MDAMTTALRVLAWALDPAGPLPAGPLRSVGALVEPGDAAVTALRRLAATTAARLGAGTPPLGDAGPVGLGTLLLAAAAGGRLEEQTATALLDAVPPLPRGPGAWAESVVRHGVVGPVLADPPPDTAVALPDAVTESLRRASPLSAVLHRPPAGSTDTARATATRLLARPHGIGVLVAALAAPVADAAVLTWRAELLELLRHGHPGPTLEVYLAARLWHGSAWDERIRWARRALAGHGSPPELAIATLRFWAPLARMHRDEEALATAGTRTRSRRPTIAGRAFLRPAEYGEAVRLVGRFRLLQEASVA